MSCFSKGTSERKMKIKRGQFFGNCPFLMYFVVLYSATVLTGNIYLICNILY